MQGVLFESQAFADRTRKRIETVRRVGLPIGITRNVVERYTSGIIAPGAIIGITPVFALGAFVTVTSGHHYDSFR